MKEGGDANAFDLIQAVEVEGPGGQEADIAEEDLDLYFDDLDEEIELEQTMC